MYPRLLVRKPWIPAAALLVSLTVAGCGGGGKPKPVAAPVVHVATQGARFSVPVGWKTTTRTPTSVAAAPPGGGDVLVAVYSFRTIRPYRPALWAAASAELDRKAEVLAQELHGRRLATVTVTVAGSRARQYLFEYNQKRAQITFFYRLRREYELYCRWTASASRPTACGLLVSDFRLL